MDYPVADNLALPTSPYNVEGYSFGEKVRSRIILHARHLGEDVIVPPGTDVTAIGDGVVVWAEIREGSQEKRNWGGLVVVGHTHKDTGEAFFSLYGHIGRLRVKTGQRVYTGDIIGEIAKGLTPENGWWKIPHLHFGIYTGPWDGKILPGYKRPFDGRTKVSWWRKPSAFIEEYSG